MVLTGVLQYDIDDSDNTDINVDELADLPGVVAVSRSASKKGVWMLVSTDLPEDGGPEAYKHAWNTYRKKHLTGMNVNCDPAVSAANSVRYITPLDRIQHTMRWHVPAQQNGHRSTPLPLRDDSAKNVPYTKKALTDLLAKSVPADGYTDWLLQLASIYDWTDGDPDALPQVCAWSAQSADHSPCTCPQKWWSFPLPDPVDLTFVLSTMTLADWKTWIAEHQQTVIPPEVGDYTKARMRSELRAQLIENDHPHLTLKSVTGWPEKSDSWLWHTDSGWHQTTHGGLLQKINLVCHQQTSGTVGKEGESVLRKLMASVTEHGRSTTPDDWDNGYWCRFAGSNRGIQLTEDSHWNPVRIPPKTG